MWGFQRQEVRWLLGLKLLETHWLKVRGGCSHLCNWCSTLDWSQGCLLGFAMAACAWQCSCRKCSPRAVPRHYTLMASEIKWTHPKHLLGIGFALRSCPGERTLHTWSADQPRWLNLSAWEHPDTIWSTRPLRLPHGSSLTLTGTHCHGRCPRVTCHVWLTLPGLCWCGLWQSV